MRRLLAVFRWLGGLVGQPHHDRLGLPAIDMLSQDLRFACRMLVKHAGFTTVAV